MLKNLDDISPLPSAILSFLTNLAEDPSVNKILVFGSRAFGDYEEYSDLDLAIDAPTMPKTKWLKFKEFASYDIRSFVRISIVHFSSNPQKLQERILSTGITIYEKQ